MLWTRYRLVISHPSMDPTVVTKTLGLEPTFPKMAGEPRITPKGTPLPGVWPDTRWSGGLKHLGDLKVEDAVGEFLRIAEPHRVFWSSLAGSGGRAQLIVSLDGRHYQGLSIEAEQLRRLADLDIALGLEIYAVQQNS